MMTRRTWTIATRVAGACLAAAVFVGCSSSPPPPPVLPGVAGDAALLPPFELEDQEGRKHRYAGAGETPVVIVVGNRHQSETNIAWDKWITAHYGERVQLYRVLDLGDVAYLFKSFVVSRVRAASDPPGIPVLLDWDGWFRARLPLSEEASNAIVLDRQGHVRLVVSGGAEGKPAAAVAAELARMKIERDDDE